MNSAAHIASDVPAVGKPARARAFPRGRRWAHGLAWILAGATVALLTAGALVTGTGSSLAVPDWPLAYGQFFPPMVGGILYEHGHRLIAATVGLLTLALALLLWRVEPRRGVRLLGWGAVLLVVFQSLLGGITVLLLLPKAVSISHALFAQIFFLTVVALVQLTAPGGVRPASAEDGRAGPIARWGGITVAALLVQLVLGAAVRHNDAGLAIPDFPLAYGGLVPPLDSFPVAIHFAHRLGAVAVLALVGKSLWEVFRGGAPGWAAAPAGAMGAIAVGQVLLGGAIIWSGKALEATTLHVVTGALLLGAAGLLTLRAWIVDWARP